MRLAINFVQRRKDKISLDQISERLPADSKILERRAGDELSEELGACLELIEHDQRLVLYLKHYQNREVKEIAHQLSLSQQTVRSRLKHGKRNLGKILEQRQVV